MLTAFAILLGLALLYIGGELLVRGSVAVASRLGMSPLVIGITLVGFGTSTPELVTSIDAALRGSPGIAVGNVVGSNIANILLILGVGAIIAPIGFTRRALSRDTVAVALSAIAIVAVAALGFVDRLIGLALFLMLVIYLVVAYVQERAGGSAKTAAAVSEEVRPAGSSLPVSLAIAIAGIAVVVLGADILVDGAIELAHYFRVPDTIIGLTIVAVGTSLPELAATVSAAFRREGSIALGNVLGSCVFNAFGILGLTAVVQPLIVPPPIFHFDAWVLLATTALMVVFALTGRLITRIEGSVFLLAYAGYVGYLVISTMM